MKGRKLQLEPSIYLDVGGGGGAEVGLLHDLLQTVHRVVSVGQNVLARDLSIFRECERTKFWTGRVTE